VEQQLAEMAEAARLSIAHLQARVEELERQTTLKTQESTFNLMAQDQDYQLRAAKLNAELEGLRQEQTAKLELERAAHQIHLDVVQREAEIRNLATDGDLMGRLIERLPQLAAELPEIKDLRVLQTGGSGYDALVNFIAQARVIAESLGVTWNDEKPSA